MKQNSSILFQVEKTGFKRVALSPKEFAELFGKSQTWGYRQIYAGKVKTITEYGRILIPAAEVERIIGQAGPYLGLKRKRVKASPKIDKWREFVSARLKAKAATAKTKRSEALQRLLPAQRNGKRSSKTSS